MNELKSGTLNREFAMQKNKRKRISIGLITVAFLVFVVIGLYNPLSVSVIALNSDKIKKTIKIALVSDLHSCKYGEDQCELVDAITDNNPDIICLTGDIFDDRRSTDNAEIFISEISAKYPCYYVTGNHEFWAAETKFDEMMTILEKYGVSRLQNESNVININGQKLNIIGVDDPESESFDLSSAKNADKEYYSILLSHRPEYLGDYSLTGVDLVLCGHAHGGQWRIPGILENGIIAPNQGLFPKYTSGMFTKRDTTMIVSRGLAKESTIVPRFYNRPEIVIIEVQ